MKKQFTLFLICICYSLHLSAQIQLGDNINGEDIDDESGTSVSFSDDGNYVAIGAPFNDGNGTYSGHVRVYKWEANNWIKIGADIDGKTAEDRSGLSVSMSSDGSRLAIGAPFSNNFAGYTRIYEWDGNNWIQLGSDIDAEFANSLAGTSVSLSDNGNIVAIGAYKNDDNGDDAGQVQIFEWNGNNWVQLGNNINGDETGDWLGISISLSADGYTLAIGANHDDDNGNNAGQVRIYEWNNNNWIQLGANIDGEATGDLSGFSVALSADASTVIIGAPLNNAPNFASGGHARVYRWNGTSWNQKGADIDGEALNDYYGYTVSISADGNRVAVGGPFNSDNNLNDSGHARIFDWNGNNWMQIGTDIDGEVSGDEFGYSLSFSADGTRIAIGAVNNDASANNAGHVRVFELEPITTSVFYFSPHENSKIATFPNPFKSSFKVEIPIVNSSDLMTFEIYDSLGKRLFKVTEDSGSTVLEITFPEEIPSGVFFLKTRIGEEIIAVNKVFKL